MVVTSYDDAVNSGENEYAPDRAGKYGAARDIRAVGGGMLPPPPGSMRYAGSFGGQTSAGMPLGRMGRESRPIGRFSAAESPTRELAGGSAFSASESRPATAPTFTRSELSVDPAFVQHAQAMRAMGYTAGERAGQHQVLAPTPPQAQWSHALNEVLPQRGSSGGSSGGSGVPSGRGLGGGGGSAASGEAARAGGAEAAGTAETAEAAGAGAAEAAGAGAVEGLGEVAALALL